MRDYRSTTYKTLAQERAEEHDRALRENAYYRKALKLICAPVPPPPLDDFNLNMCRVLQDRILIAQRAMFGLELIPARAPTPTADEQPENLYLQPV